IDVERLVEDLRARVARAREEGAYGDDLTGVALAPPPPEPRVRFRPELAYSTKPLVGRPLTLLKRALMRLIVHPLDDMARQADAAIGADREWARAAVTAEAGARERVQDDVLALLERIEAIEGTLERLQLAPRLARLERRARAAAAPAAPSGAGAEGPAAAPAAPSDAGVDYLGFEARFRGDE